jgi:hypothetical protein
VKSVESTRSQLRDLLKARQLPAGGWSYLASSSQAAIEPTCLALLALAGTPSQASDLGYDFLRRTQNSNGSWPAFTGDDAEGAWVTSLALIALHDSFRDIDARLRGFSWLMNSFGREAHWFWRWKFRTTDRQVRFDPDKSGWPWMPGTNSWVVPTAFAMLALRQLPCTCGFENAPIRVQLGIDMLLDRACPKGGWNAGNGVVYGVPLAAHPDTTAIALLALAQNPQNALVQSSLRWLGSIAGTLSAPWSLAWSILALAAYNMPVEDFTDRLAAVPELDQPEDNASLAVTLLALDRTSTLRALGVTT